MATPSPSGGIGRVLSQRNYRLYFIGNSVSILGFWVYRAAIGWLTWELTGSPAWLGIIGFVSTAPAVFVAPLAGAVADRFGLRRVATLALAFNAVNGSVLAFLAFAGLVSVEVILLIALLHGLAVAFDLPARVALVPDLIDKGDLSAAIALNSAVFHAGAFVGPALFAGLNAVGPIAWSFVFNAAGYFVFVTTFLLMRQTEAPKPASEAKKGLFLDVVEGLRYVTVHKEILSVFLLSATGHLLLRPYIDLLPGFSAGVFGRGAEGYAVLLSTVGAGSIVSGIWLARRGRTRGLARVMVVSLAASALALLVFALGTSFAVALVCMFFAGFFLLSVAVSNQSLVQNRLPREVRGRVVSISTAMAMGFPALGVLVLGTIGDFTGVQGPVAGAAILAAILLIPLARRLFRAAPLLEADRAADE